MPLLEVSNPVGVDTPYPWVQPMQEAIWDGFWTVKKFTFDSDIQNFKHDMTPEQKRMILRSLAAISQIEVKVKKFWAFLGMSIKDDTITGGAITMAGVEEIHNNAYKRLLLKLGLRNAIDESLDVPAVAGRANYLTKHSVPVFAANHGKQVAYSVTLFTIFVEYVSLFAYFANVLHMKRAHGFLKDTAQQVTYTRNEETCFSSDTEVLTPSGWRKIFDMKVGDDILQYTGDGTLERTTVMHTVRKQHSGKMISFTRKGNHCLVTPDHDMIVRFLRDEDGVLRKIKAADVKMHKEMTIPRTASLAGGTVSQLSAMDQLRIAIQADGSRLYWTNSKGEKVWRGKSDGANYAVSVKKDRKIERLRKTLDLSGISYTESEPDTRGYVRFSIAYPGDENLKSLSWIDLSDKTASWCKAFIEEVSHWDGWCTKTGGMGYCSISRENVDIVHSIGVMAGFHVSVTPKIDNRSDTYSDSWRVNFTNANSMPISHSMKKVEVDYDGEVGCITVPSGMLMTRRGDSTFIAGNCHALFGAGVIREMRKEYPELFDAELEAKIVEETHEAFKAECQLIDWVMEGYDDPEHNADILKEYVKQRFNEGLEMVGYNPIFNINQELLAHTDWMKVGVYAPAQVDFFVSEPTGYVQSDASDDDDF